jgi:hypothetical protein
MRKRLLRSAAILTTSFAPLSAQESAGSGNVDVLPIALGNARLPRLDAGKFPWKHSIVTTTFWVGEQPTKNNPTPNHISSWDTNWSQSFGGTDHPDADRRVNFLPAKFTPKQNPFYVALPYNDCMLQGYKPEASQVIPWFKEGPLPGSKRSVCKGRWVAIRYGKRVAYAQWEDAGPFRTDHWQYVFGSERPKMNLNKGAGLDVSPAVRDYLGMKDTDLTDWKFVNLSEVPEGPWAQLGGNNPLALQKQAEAERLARISRMKPLAVILEQNLTEIMHLGRGGLRGAE